MKHFLPCARPTAFSATKKITKKIEFRASRIMSAIRSSWFLKSMNPTLRELVGERILQVVEDALAVYMNEMKKGHISELFFIVF